jgi:hypothetical protein
MKAQAVSRSDDGWMTGKKLGWFISNKEGEINGTTYNFWQFGLLWESDFLVYFSFNNCTEKCLQRFIVHRLAPVI